MVGILLRIDYLTYMLEIQVEIMKKLKPGNKSISQVSFKQINPKKIYAYSIINLAYEVFSPSDMLNMYNPLLR